VVTGTATPVVLLPSENRVQGLVAAASLAGWMGYTRLFAPLVRAHATLPECPFLLVTGHPCPFCGGTRAFAYAWQGEWLRAVRMYPLGPLLFVLTVLAIPALLFAVITRRQISLPPQAARAVVAVALVALAVNWSLKLTVLPN
jgi:hypothetical protein